MLKPFVYINKIKNYFVRLLILFINKLNFYRQKVKYPHSATLNGVIFISNRGKITIGNRFKCNSGKNNNPIGGDTVMRLICLKEAEIKIGNNVRISNCTILAQKQVIIEDNVTIGGSCKIWDTDFHSLDSNLRGTPEDVPVNKAILIKKNSFIGASSIILKGVSIGENSIIGAGSVVGKSVPDNEIWGGNPACFIKFAK